MNTVVTMSYEIRDAENNILESSKEPITYLHGGYDQIFPKVEEAIHNKVKEIKLKLHSNLLKHLVSMIQV